MQKVAVIGLSCLFPGAHTPDQFIQNLNQNVDSTQPHATEQMGADPALYFSAEKGQPDKFYSLKGGYISDFNFDPAGFELEEALLLELDDMYQWSLYVAREALKNGGVFRDFAKLKSCGVILGNLSFPTKRSNSLFLPLYHQTVEAALQSILQSEAIGFPRLQGASSTHPINGRISGYPSALIAQALGLSGACFSLDAACASSLYSVKLACDYLNSGKADLMLAGAVSAGDPFFINQGFSTFTAYSANGISCPLDKRSEGLISGEGAGMILLKRLDDAIRDNDYIHAVIAGIGLSNDGRGRSVLSPHTKGQLLAYERAYQNTTIRPHQIDYIECHATGTPVGDRAELESLDLFFGKHNASPLIGAVKANFGHLLTSAGITSMLKVILSMSQSRIPATIHLKHPVSSPSGVIKAEQVVSAATPWPSGSTLKYGAVNAFGFGGTNAHLVFEEPTKQVTKTKADTRRPGSLAIIGMDACFGPFQNLDAFDHAIYSGKQGFVPLPENRWKGLNRNSSLLESHGFREKGFPTGAYLEEFSFDTLRYKIPPNEIAAMIPQQLVMLKVADNAVRDAGLREGGNVAVIVAMEADKSLHQFRGRIDLDWMTDRALEDVSPGLSYETSTALKKTLKDSIRKPVQVNEFTSFIGNIMASRISALWDFSGPAFTLSAEDNSVYKALEVAQLLLDNKEVDAVVVGAVDLSGNAEEMLLRNRYERPYATGDLSAEFDVHWSGFKVGEGAGAVVLKSGDETKKHNHRCYATIDAIAFAASCEPEVIQNCLQDVTSATAISAADVGLWEFSGVEKGDAFLEGTSAFCADNPDFSAALASTTATIGHTYVASGMASLIKTTLCLFHRYIPAVPGWNGLKSIQEGKGNPFYVPTVSGHWYLGDASRRTASVGGAGSDGSFAGLILSESPTPQRRTNAYFRQEELFFLPVSAADKTALLAKISSLSQLVSKSDDLYRLVCHLHASENTEPSKPYNVSLVGMSKEGLLKEIESASSSIAAAFDGKRDWSSPSGSYFTADPLAGKGDLAFVYPGAFNSYLGMGRDTFRLFPDLADVLSTHSRNSQQLLYERLLYPRSTNALSPADEKRLQEALEANAIPTFETGIQFAILKTALLRGAFGIQPKAVFGHSMGEVSMAFAMGLWQSTEQMSQALHNTPLFRESLAGAMNTARTAWGLPAVSTGSRPEAIWSSFSIQGPAEEISRALADYERVYLLLINSPTEVIIGGETAACLQFLDASPFQAMPSQLHDVIHCQLVETERQEIYEMHHSPVVPNNDIQLYSAAGYDRTVQGSHELAEQIASVYCKTLDFPRLVDRVYQGGSRIFLEIGPKANCSHWIDEILAGRDHLAVSVDMKGTPEIQALFRALAKLFSHGVAMDFAAVYPGRDAIPSAKTRAATITLGGNDIHRSIVKAKIATTVQLQKQPSSTATSPEKSSSVANAAQPQKPSLTPLNQTETERKNQSVDPMLLSQVEPAVFHHQSHISQTHAAFLTARNASLKHLREMIKLQMILSADHPVSLVREEPRDRPFKGDPYLYPETRRNVSSNDIIWNEEDLLEFAGGHIARVFGKAFEIIDSYTYRVRLPLPPYLLVNRVTRLDAKTGELKPSSLITEYDIAKDAWFSVDGQIPWAIASEAGQCDLLLISYLGIDFKSKGKRYYRLTDYTMTFFDELPKEGETLRYEIHIDSFFWSGEALFFNFGYDCFVRDKKVYQMTGGRAGFSSDAELAKGKGVVIPKAEEKQRKSIVKRHFEPLLTCSKTSFSRDELLHITQGNIAACLGQNYDQAGLNPSLRFAAAEIMMIDRITSIDPKGGPWGLGEVIAEKDLAPDNWYFPCHFKDDNVLAGTLITEGCVQLLGFYMLYLGLQVNTRNARFQPVKNRPYSIRARGQIVPSDTRFSYKMEIIEVGLQPRPFARANFYIMMNNKILVDFRDLGVELLEKSPTDPAYRGLASMPAKHVATALYGPEIIDEFATGSLARCFGPEFKIYENRKGPRTPNGDLQLVSRIMELKGERNNFKFPSELTAEYDVPADAWFFNQNSCPIVPYSIVMEIALQPCAFLSASMGTTLLYPEAELCFRNLSATADLITVPDLRGRTVVIKNKMNSVSKAAETLVMDFEFELLSDGIRFFKGVTQFGYFTPNALSMQKGLDRGTLTPPWFESKGIASESGIRFDLRADQVRKQLYHPDPNRPFYRLADGQLDFLDEATVFENQGNYGKGYVFASKQVDAADWFYPNHFYNDPVMPGSLGVEAILQAMKIFAIQQNISGELRSPRFLPAPGTTKWLYRGQITPDDKRMDLEVHISSLEYLPHQIVLKADANLWKNGIRIYEITDAAIAIIGEHS